MLLPALRSRRRPGPEDTLRRACCRSRPRRGERPALPQRAAVARELPPRFASGAELRRAPRSITAADPPDADGGPPGLRPGPGADLRTPRRGNVTPGQGACRRNCLWRECRRRDRAAVVRSERTRRRNEVESGPRCFGPRCRRRYRAAVGPLHPIERQDAAPTHHRHSARSRALHAGEVRGRNPVISHPPPPGRAACCHLPWHSWGPRHGLGDRLHSGGYPQRSHAQEGTVG